MSTFCSCAATVARFLRLKSENYKIVFFDCVATKRAGARLYKDGKLCEKPQTIGPNNEKIMA